MVQSPRNLLVHTPPFTRNYDPNGNLTQFVTRRGTFTYDYDERDQCSAVLDPGMPSSSIAGGATNLSYDTRMLLIRQDNINGSSTTLTYDPARRLTQIRHFTNAGAEIERAFYGYDAANRPLYRDAGSGLVTWGYDLRDRLTSESSSTGLVTW